ncbi:MAG: hypothetical protein K9K64_06200 [Desulfohalobiaceae bacterium]|nr:hypothetical protein [Desulfohalobiaceae bacterium]
MTEIYSKEPYKSIADNMDSGWREYLTSLESSLNQLEKDIEEASQMSDACTSEWCTATEHVIDELSNALFTIHEPSFATDQDTKKLKGLKKKVHELYAKYKTAAA